MTAAVPIVVERLYGLPPLIIEDGPLVARFFFESDASAVGSDSFDAWVEMNARNRFDRHDIEVINGPMRARSPYEAWQPLLDEPSPAWLTVLDEGWDLVETTDADWQSADCEALLDTAVTNTAAKGIGRAMATKVLHMKRPRLVPILDSLVIQTIGGRTDDYPTPTPIAITHLRKVARANAASLAVIAEALLDLPIRPSLARILDSLLWIANPRSSLHAALGWPTRLEPLSHRRKG